MAQRSSARVYTARDESVERAMRQAVDAGLVSDHASLSERVHALITYAGEQLTEREEREARIAAYSDLARDDERREAIYSANLLAIEDGIL